ncbi:MAG: alpha/beta fold hydrolase [SAR202 cluster bacterium]|nr:alpha/beta fold hydrolase [SAR202 cluster bacterium]
MTNAANAPHAGHFKGGLPFNRLGNGPEPLVVFRGLLPEHKPLSGVTARAMLSPFRPLARRYTVYVVTRRPGLPAGCTLADMADDYADMVRDEFGGPVRVIGISTGGSIAQHFAADHPELVRRLVLYSAAHRLGDEGRRFQRRLAELAGARRWAALAAESLAFMYLPKRGLARRAAVPATWLVRLLAVALFRPPSDASDYLVTIEAEDAFDFRDRLGEIRAPALFRETAAGMPRARLVLYERAGHGPTGKRVTRDLLAFLAENGAAPGAGA